MTFDTFTFFNELDLLEIRLNILDSFVDKFVLVEAPETFSGLPKPLYYEENKARFKKWWPKIIHQVVTDYPQDQEINEQAKQDKLRIPDGFPHYHRAFYQKESIRRALKGADDEDLIYFGDADEIWKPKEIDDGTYKLKQLCYSYYLNNRSSEDWRGTIVTRYKNVKNGSLTHFRGHPTVFLEDGGWHFSNLGGPEAVIKKLESYDHQEFNSPALKQLMAQKIANNEDYIVGSLPDEIIPPGLQYRREFRFWKDESELPAYLLENQAKYQHLWK